MIYQSKKPKSIFYKPEYSSGNDTSELEKILEKERIFSNPKPFELLYDFFKIAIKQDSVVLDFSQVLQPQLMQLWNLIKRIMAIENI